MNTVATAESTYQKDDTFDNILRHLKFGITLIAAGAYGIEKAWRLPVVAGGVADEMDALIDSPLVKVISYFNILSYACTASTFFDPLFREEGSILCFKFKGNSQVARRIFTIIVLALAGVGIIYVYCKNRTLIATKKKEWQKQISIASSTIIFFYGAVQLYLLWKNWDDYKGRRLFAISSVVVDISALVEIYGMDQKIYKAEKRGLAYAAIYGGRTIAKAAQAVGILTAGE